MRKNQMDQERVKAVLFEYGIRLDMVIYLMSRIPEANRAESEVFKQACARVDEVRKKLWSLIPSSDEQPEDGSE